MFLELFTTFAKIGAFTFGGGYAMISLIEHECVEKKKWITSEELTDMTVIAESTPGPVAINCATYTGYKKGGMKGAICATVGMVLPSFIVIMLISTFMENLLQYEITLKIFKGIRIAVGFLIARAGITMVKKMLKTTNHKVISVGFVLTFFFIAMILNLLQISFSTVYFILISGMLSFCIFTMAEKEGKS